MTYSVKEVFYTLQGEGLRAGRPAVFCRFAGCNLWTGREEDRLSAICQFCDTDFVGTDGTLGGKFSTAQELADLIMQQWPIGKNNRYVVLTGGEPLLQVNKDLIDALHKNEFEIAVETFIEGDLKKSKSLFTKLQKLNPGDKAVLFYLSIISYYEKVGVPKEWHGTVEMDSK